MYKNFLGDKSINIVKGEHELILIDFIDNSNYKFTVKVPQEALIILTEKLSEFVKSKTLPTKDIEAKYFVIIPNYKSLFDFTNSICAFMFTGVDNLTGKPKGSLNYLFMDDFLQFAQELIDFKNSLEEA